jgi:hypothetical protein
MHETVDRTVNNHKWHIFGANGGAAIATHYFQYTYGEPSRPYEDFNETRANALLMTAAPELLEALRTCQLWLENPAANQLERNTAAQFARAAIAKARGQSANSAAA